MEIVVPSGAAEEIVGLLESRYGAYDSFRILVSPLEAMVPRREAADEEEEQTASGAPINVEELHQEVLAQSRLDTEYTVSIAIAAIVAAAGIVRGSTELIVASMILAPLLGPSMALATATALGDLEMGRRAILATGAGIGISLMMGAAMGAIFGVPIEATHVTGRLSIGVLDFVVAGTAGTAGALSYTSGAFGRIVGVMIAVALLPPMVLTGMLIGDMQFTVAIWPGLITMINLIAINLSGVAVLFIRKIRPRRIYEQDRARRAVIGSIVIWGLTFVVLILLAILVNASGLGV